MRYFFEVSYNGSKYSGWQSQLNARGIQQVIEESFEKIFRKQIPIIGSGRTDAGVHCEQQFFHADFTEVLDITDAQFRLNSLLPRDIAIRSIHPVHEDANARYDAFERTYQYRITTEKNPFAEGRAWHYFKPLDLQHMNTAAAVLLGKKDFECFSKVKTDVNNFICEIKRAEWQQTGKMIVFTIAANRFLRGMVRAIVGTLTDVGTGKTSIGEFESILESRDRREAGANVPPYGLYLVEVKYPEHIFLTTGEDQKN